MPNQPTTLLLINGAVIRCRPVPPYVQASVRGALPEPPVPRVAVTSAAGGKEEHIALEGTPEFDAYVIAQRKWRYAIATALQSFIMNYGVVEWRWPAQIAPGEEAFDVDVVWESKPPIDWSVPSVMERYGLSSTDEQERRAQYIMHELITTEADQDALEALLLPMQPLTKEEVMAALSPFESSATVDLSSILRQLQSR